MAPTSTDKPGTPVDQHIRRLLAQGYPRTATILIVRAAYQGKHRVAE